jgi:hypothetical protein
MTGEPGTSGPPPSKRPALDPLQYSEKAATELEQNAQDYLTSLEQMSQSIARTKQADSVSASHVRLAAEALGFKSSGRSRWTREIGALTIGVGLTNLASVLLTSSYDFLSAVLICVPVLGGFAMYLYGLARDQ